MQFSEAVRNARLDAIETTTGTAAVLRIRSGAAPANAAAADSGTVLAEMTLPSNWMADAAAGVKGLLGTWEDADADATGTAGHYRIYESTGTTCHIQGPVSASGGGGELILDNTSIAPGQPVTVSAFNITAGNA